MSETFRAAGPTPNAAVRDDAATNEHRIAVIGLAGRFPTPEGPTAADPLDSPIERFWRQLVEGVEAVRTLSPEALRAEGISDELIDHPSYVRKAVVLDDIDRFDAELFGYGRREVEVMDPQHRLFLECAWEAFEDAGYDIRSYDGPVGIFGSVMGSTYLLNNLASRPRVMANVGPLMVRIQNDKDFFSTRVSYKLNLRGPGMSVQTACSSSLVAVHLACQSLLSHECDMALVGGASIGVPQVSGYLYAEGGIYSPDGHCRAFDADAKGTVSGNGIGAVVLKPLDHALEDGDPVRAVILGSAINNDGSLKVGYTAPSVEGQAEVVAAAQEFAGVDPDSLGYIEAHGTGTSMGDPIEVAALTQVFRQHTRRRSFCALGSIKTNIGHLDSAAGVVGLIKTVLALEHGEIPPSLNCSRPNPRIDFPSTPFFVATERIPWPATDTPRRAGVSSLGVGGTNAHVILEEAPRPSRSGRRSTRPWHLLTLSARTPGAVEQASERLARHLERHPETLMDDVAYTLAVGRADFAHRRILVCRDLDDAIRGLRPAAGEPDRRITAVAPGERREVVFLFPGQGSQYPGMGRGLYATEKVYREVVDHCAKVLEPHLELDLRQLLHPRDEELEAAGRKLQQTRFAQPAIFVVSYALARLWQARGITPRAFVGHSVGEWVAACLAGVTSLEDALDVVAFRGRLMQSLPRGGMLSVALEEDELSEALAGTRVELSAVNAPGQCTVAGPMAAITELARTLEERRVETRRLQTSHAFHSAMMEPILKAWGERLAGLDLRPPEVPYLSNVTGTWIRADEATDPHYWVEHVRRPVHFSAAVSTLVDSAERVFLEVGPGRVLTNLARRHRRSQPGGEPARTVPTAVPSMRHPRDEGDDVAVLLEAFGRLWQGGVAIDWRALYADAPGRRVALPTYPFERQRYWIDRAVPTVESAVRGAVPGRALVVVGRTGVASALRDALRQQGIEAVLIEPQDPAESDTTEPGVYRLRTADGSDAEAWAASLDPVPSVVLRVGLAPESAPDLCLPAWRAPQIALSSDAAVEDLDGAPSRRFEALARHLAALVRAALAAATLGPAAEPELGKAGATTAGSPAEPARAPSDLEARVVEVWQELLGVDGVAPADDFLELGGNSLLATQLLSRLRDRLGLVVALVDFLAEPSVAGLLRRSAVSAADTEPPLVPVPRDAPLPLSFAQHQLWVLAQLNPDSAAYNMPAAVRLDGPLEVDSLARAVDGVVSRHESLRTRFVLRDGEACQEIATSVPTPFAVVDLRDHADPEAAARQRVRDEVDRPFRLDRAPLLRLTLLRLADERWQLLLVIHHIVSDGWSMNLLLRELMTLYGAELEGAPSPLEPLSVQMADHAVWQRRRLEGGVLQQQIAPWVESLAGAPERLLLPTDHPRPEGESPRGASLAVALPETLVTGIRRLGQTHGCTPFMVYLAAYAVLMRTLSGQDDLVIGSGITGRHRQELEGLIGFLVNTLALRLRCDRGTSADTTIDPGATETTGVGDGPTFRDFLAQVREVTLRAYASPEVPLEAIIDALGLARDPSYSPLVQVVLTYIGHPSPPRRVGAVELSPQPFDLSTAKFDLELALVERDHSVLGIFVYRSGLFDDSTAAAMLEDWQLVLRWVIDDDTQTLGALSMRLRRIAEDRRTQSRQKLKIHGQESLKRIRRRSMVPST